MVRVILFLAMFTGVLNAQERFTHKNLVCSRGSIAYGNLLSIKAEHTYFDGSLEYFVAPDFSIRGDGYYYVDAINDYRPFEKYHSLFSAGVYHFPSSNNIDTYAGAAIGVNIAKAVNPCLGKDCLLPVYPEEPKISFAPCASLLTGIRYFAPKWFHIALEVRYVAGKFIDNYNAENAGELRFSFGLGLNIF